MKLVKNSMNVNVSVNVTVHREGILLYKTLRAIRACLEFAKAGGLSVELNFSLDNADEETRNAVSDFIKMTDLDINTYEVNLDDPGLSRNFLIEKSHGKYIAFFDGDDFFTENYILESFNLAEKNSKPAIYVAKHIINFGAVHCLMSVFDSDSKSISKRYFFESNYYVSQNFVHNEVYKKIKYVLSKNCYGYEDWHFNCEALAMGYEFITVPETIFFYRRKETLSVLGKHVLFAAALRSTKLLHPQRFMQLKNKEATSQQNFNSINNLKQSSKNKLVVVKNSLRKRTFLYRYIKTSIDINTEAVRAIKQKISGRNGFAWKQIDDTQQGLSIYKKIEQNEVDIPGRLKEVGLTKKAVEFWGRLNRYEPMIRASWDMLEYIPIAEYPTDSGMSNAYYDLCKSYGENEYTDMVLVPHMIRGGAELATLHLLRALSAQGRKALVLATIDTESAWGDKVREIPGVDFIESKDIFLHVPHEDKRLDFILRMLQNWSFVRLTIINSELGYKLAIKYEKVLKDIECEVFVHTYAFDVTEDGYLFNYIPNGLVDLYGATTRYITDSEVYKKQLVEMNGFNEERITPLYLPSNLSMKKKVNYKKTKKIIYAGRICNQKIADVAVEVGMLLADHDIELHFYGNIDPEYAENDKFLKMIEPYPAIQYHGVFEGSHSLNLDAYDMFLLTTRTEGIPNTIIETCGANLFVVTAAVGGLTECIQQGKNGLLVADEDKFKPSKYAEAIITAYDKNLFSDQETIDQANDIVRTRHSLEKYDADVASIMNLGDA